MEIHVVEGHLECPETQRKFAITDGIPNMLLLEDELPFVDEKQETHETETQEMKSQNENAETKSDEAKTETAETAENPYVDASLMQSLETFSPKANADFVSSRVVPTKNKTHTETVKA